MTPIKPEASAVLLTQFAGYLLSRVEAIETLLLEKKIVSKEEIRAAIRSGEASLTRQTEIYYRDEEERERAIADSLKRLRSRVTDRLR
jgi:hypothetical protein